VSCHIQDIPENGADLAHLPAVHKAPILVGGNPGKWAEELGSNLITHEWQVRWQPDGGRGHVAKVNLRQTIKVLGKY